MTHQSKLTTDQIRLAKQLRAEGKCWGDICDAIGWRWAPSRLEKYVVTPNRRRAEIGSVGPVYRRGVGNWA